MILADDRPTADPLPKRSGARPAVRGAAFALAVLVAGGAGAQDNTTTVIPAPGAERYSLPPGNAQTPVPTPTVPTPSLTPAPPPSAIPTLRLPTTTPTPAATPTATPASRATPDRRPAPAVAQPEPTPAATATPDIAPAAPLGQTPVATPTPDASEPATQAALPVTPSPGPPTWLWWALGLGAAIGVAALAWRRFGRRREEAITYASEVAAPEPTPVPQPGPPARPVIGAAPAAAPAPDRALVLDFRPQRLWTRGPDAHLAFELVVTNGGTVPVDAVRPVIVLASAGPDTAAEIAAFQANAPQLPGIETFALRAGETRTVAGELTLPGDAMYVTSAADRELIVPVALVGVGWRAGVSLARTSEAFVIGTGDASAPRLGPIWVDRAGLVYPKLDARRFTAGPG